MSTKKLITFDYGASSGRAILGEFDGERISIRELHRFSNDPVQLGEHLHWDILRLFYELKQGLIKASLAGAGDAASIGVDTWGCDFGLLDENGLLVSNPFHYRDSLTEGEMEEVERRFDRRTLYGRAGLQFMRFNTLYQLSALRRKAPGLLERAKDLLLTPDLLNYFLTGKKAAEFSIVSTTQMYHHASSGWDTDLLSQLGVDGSMLQQIVPSGTKLGPILPHIADETGISAPVTAVCGHDTGSAFLAVPMAEGERCAILSCGTWSLLGVELAHPVLTDEAFAVDYTNEGGYGGTVRFLKNIMGLWIYGEVKREFERREGAVDYKTLDAEIEAAPSLASFIDPDREEFFTPGHMAEKVRDFCRRTGQRIPSTRGEVLRCVLESLALKYRYSIDALEQVLSTRFDRLRVVGGGCKDRLLMRFTANALGRPVLAGPVEATALGNMAAQLITLGEASDRWEVRRIISSSFGTEEFVPDPKDGWAAAYASFRELLSSNQ